MKPKINTIEIMINDAEEEVVKKHFDSLKNRYQIV